MDRVQVRAYISHPVAFAGFERNRFRRRYFKGDPKGMTRSSLSPVQQFKLSSQAKPTAILNVSPWNTPRQAHAKQQRRQILARQEETKATGGERGGSDAGSLAQARSASASLTDGEDTPTFTRKDRYRRYRQASRASDVGGCHSDSEVVVCDNSNASR